MAQLWKRRRRLALAGAIVLMLGGATTAAHAQERPNLGELTAGYTYYNLPGASVEDHNREVADCFQRTKMWTSDEPPIAGGLIFHLLWDGSIAGMMTARIENCMIVKGWRVVDIGQDRGMGLADTDVATLAATLATEIGSTSPNGRVVRKWANEALDPDGYTFAQTPRTPGKQQLSLRLYAQSSPPDVMAVRWPGLPKIDKRWPKGRLKANELDKAPPGSAIILVRTVQWSVGFDRMGENPEDLPAFRDQAPGRIFAGISRLLDKKDGDWFAFAVPPGRWRVAGYCMGSPAFDVAAGEIVYAGEFRRDPDMRPNLAMEPALAWLGPEKAGRARPAVYRNGAQGPCRWGEAFLYALEYPGAGYEPGYAWGGAAPSLKGKE